ncbi:kinase C-like protein [Helicostylum pulchrum]|nr:kinase C-like protein [Helicostylum pulchrum]
MGNIDSTECSRQAVNLSQFTMIKTIGQGAFGKVYKVKRRQKLYALKVISKEKCIKMEAVSNIIRERTMLEFLDHPLVCNMRFAFQDTDYIYMAMDLMSAGDLRFHLTIKQHDEITIKFWMAELVCAVKYLHSQGIIHRDIKPDNILLDECGHIHLSDFNIACQIPNKSRRLKSLSGTAVYFAPEVFQSNGYTEDVDWWSVGITFYECVYGTRPWSHCTNIDELSKQILQKNILYPKTSYSNDCISAIQCLLEKNPKKRMGHGIMTGWHSIVKHAFFKSIQWYKIDSKQYQPVYEPITEEKELSDHANNGIDWLCRRRKSIQNRQSQDLKILETGYKSFDYTIFDQYEGFLDDHLMTVGPPPHWVKPAFPDADNGSVLPITKIHLELCHSITAAY